jgi:death-on-curing protein
VAEPAWITRQVVEIIHLEQLGEHGGRRGLVDEGRLEAAIDRPRQHLAYRPEASVPALAAELGHALVTGHPFVDGNKRVGLLAMFVFLALNGLSLDAPEVEAADTIEHLAEGSLGVEDLAGWIEHWTRLK